MKISVRSFIVAGSMFAFCTLRSLAVDATYNNLEVNGQADFTGANTTFGTSGTINPGVTLSYVDGTSGVVSVITSKSSAVWQWGVASGTSSLVSMKLDTSNQLILYTTGTGGAAAITLNPAGTSTMSGNITINGTNNLLPNQVLTSGSSILTQSLGDGRYFPLTGTLSASNISGTLSGSVAGVLHNTGSENATFGTLILRTGSISGGGMIASGSGALASGTNAIALGGTATASGSYSIAIGASSSASGVYSVALGDFATAQGYNQFVIGRYNILQGSGTAWSGTDDLFTAGNGSGTSSRANAFVIKKNGDTTINGALVVSGTTGSSNVISGSTTFSASVTIGGTGTSGSAANFTGSGTNNTLSHQTLTGGGSILTEQLGDSRYAPLGTSAATSLVLNGGDASGDSNIAGFDAYASGDHSVALGQSSTASGANSMALGYYSYAGGDKSMALGYFSTAEGSSSFAVGENSYASGDDSVTFGVNSHANGASSMASGYNAMASADYSLALGYNASANGGYSVAIGYYSYTSADYSIALNSSAQTSGPNSLAMGYDSETGGNYSSTLGAYSYSGGQYSGALGYSSVTYADFSMAVGPYSNASAQYALTLGYYSTATGEYSTAIGANSYSSAQYALTLGCNSAASGDYSVSAGYGTTSQSYVECVVGQYNDTSVIGNSSSWDSGDSLFVVGNGADAWDPSNALVVKKSGDTAINGNITVGGTSPNPNKITNGGLIVVSGTDSNGTYVATGTNQLVLIPQQGDLSMGAYTSGPTPH